MKRDKPHPVILILCLMAISALITGCETVAHYRHPEVQPRVKKTVMVRNDVKPAATNQLSEESTILPKEVHPGPQLAGPDAIVLETLGRTGEDVKVFAVVESYLAKTGIVAAER